MFPWGHAALAYLVYSGSSRRLETRVTAAATVALLVASQLPDLIDKPLAWTWPILPNGRSLAHSLLSGSLVLGVVLTLVLVVGARRVVLPIVLAYYSHLFADALEPAVYGQAEYLAFLAWPALPPVQYTGPKSFLGHALTIDPTTPFFLLQIVLVVAALLTWHRDGRPGLDPVRAWFDGRLAGPVESS